LEVVIFGKIRIAAAGRRRAQSYRGTVLYLAGIVGKIITVF
jgi:hypothetical protein